jgi:hypothetical protein
MITFPIADNGRMTPWVADDYSKELVPVYDSAGRLWGYQYYLNINNMWTWQKEIQVPPNFKEDAEEWNALTGMSIAIPAMSRAQSAVGASTVGTASPLYFDSSHDVDRVVVLDPYTWTAICVALMDQQQLPLGWSFRIVARFRSNWMNASNFRNFYDLTVFADPVDKTKTIQTAATAQYYELAQKPDDFKVDVWANMAKTIAYDPQFFAGVTHEDEKVVAAQPPVPIPTVPPVPAAPLPTLTPGSPPPTVEQMPTPPPVEDNPPYIPVNPTTPAPTPKTENVQEILSGGDVHLVIGYRDLNTDIEIRYSDSADKIASWNASHSSKYQIVIETGTQNPPAGSPSAIATEGIGQKLDEALDIVRDTLATAGTAVMYWLENRLKINAGRSEVQRILYDYADGVRKKQLAQFGGMNDANAKTIKDSVAGSSGSDPDLVYNALFALKDCADNGDASCKEILSGNGLNIVDDAEYTGVIRAIGKTIGSFVDGVAEGLGMPSILVTLLLVLLIVGGLFLLYRKVSAK